MPVYIPLVSQQQIACSSSSIMPLYAPSSYCKRNVGAQVLENGLCVQHYVFLCVCVLLVSWPIYGSLMVLSLNFAVFDDGDEKTLRRSSLCLKGARHFAESEVRTVPQFWSSRFSSL